MSEYPAPTELEPAGSNTAAMVAEPSLEYVIKERVSGTSQQFLQQQGLPHRLMAQIQHGVPGSVLSFVAAYVPRQILIEAIGSDPTNFNKLYRRKLLSKVQTDTLDDVTKLWFELRQFFDFNEKILQEWIGVALPALDGATPATLMETIAGRNQLRACLDNMKYGDFA